MIQQNLPYRLRESAFRIYEPDIAQVVQKYPSLQVFTPKNVETFSNRLRDAMRSLWENRWSCSWHPDFVRIYPRLIVAIRGSFVLVGTRGEVQLYDSEEPRNVINTPPVPPLLISNPDQRSLEGLFTLHHNRLFSSPTRLHFDDPIEFVTTIPKWEENYDIAITPVESGDGKTFDVL